MENSPMRYNIQEATQLQICAFIRTGGVPWVCAEATGVPRRVFHRWMARGERNPKAPFGPFYEQVLKAQAQARLKAEVELREQNALQWLKCGPGKEYPGLPGWSEPIGPQEHAPHDAAITQTETFQLLGVLNRVLQKYPGALDDFRGQINQIKDGALARFFRPKAKPERPDLASCTSRLSETTGTTASDLGRTAPAD
jgi:hypothetical protein